LVERAVEPARPDPQADLDPGELSPAAGLGVQLRRLAGDPAFRRFGQELRAKRCEVLDPRPWIAAALGLADPREVAARAFRRAERRLARLRKLPPEARLAAIRYAAPAAGNPALPLLLLEESRRRLGGDPREALAWLDLGEEAVEHLAGAGFPERALVPHSLRLAAHRGNALRILGELPAAERIFQGLAAHPRRGELGHFGDLGELLSLEASLRIDQRRWEAAEELLAQAESAYAARGEGVGVAKVLLQRGTLAEYAGEPAVALTLYRRAGALLDSKVEPMLLLATKQNQASALVDLHQPDQARAVLASARCLLESDGEPALRQRWAWTEARIARLEGRFDEAAASFDKTCTGFLALQRPYGAALVLLDAAELQLARGHWQEVQSLAGRLEAVFAVRGVHAEARKALVLFQEAARGEALTAEFLARLRHYLLVGRNDPRFRFDAARPAAMRPE
jgi:hypothetical protein